MSSESYERELSWKKSAGWGLLMFLALGLEWLQTGKRPTVEMLVLVSVFIVGCMIAEATGAIVARLESIMREILNLRQVGDTLLSRTADIANVQSAQAGIGETTEEVMLRLQQIEESLSCSRTTHIITHNPDQPGPLPGASDPEEVG